MKSLGILLAFVVFQVSASIAAGPATQPGQTVDLLVIDQATKAPLGGASVVTSTGPADDWHGTTAGDGHVAVPVSHTTGWTAALVKAYGHIPMMVVWGRSGPDAAPTTLPSNYTLAMQTGTHIGGKVVDDDGKPVANAHVMLFVPIKSKNAMERPDLNFVDVQADADGNWNFDGVPAQIDSISIAAWDYHHVFAEGEGMAQVAPYTDIAKLRDGSATFTVKKGLAVDGVVLGPDGKPLKGARIGVGPDRFGSNQIPDFVTEDDGKFSFAFGGTMSVCLTIQAKGCAPELNEFQMAGQPQKLTIQLSPAKTLSGTVTDAKGQPIAGAMVSIDTWREHRTLADDILTADGDGKFTWDQAPADTVYADVMADGYMRQRTVALTAGKENIVKLQFPAHVTLKVTDDATGEPIKGFRVTRGAWFSDAQPISWLPDSRDDQKAYDGSFSYTLGFPYAGYALRAQADGYLPADTRVFKSDEGDIKLDLKLKKADAAAVSSQTILQPDGKPAAGARIVLALGGQGAMIMNEQVPIGMGQLQYTSASDGTVTIPPQTGPYRILVLHDAGTAELDQDSQHKTRHIQLQAWGTIQGRLMIGNKPGAGEKVWAQLYEDTPQQYDPTKPRIYHQIQADCDADGKFVISRVPPGKVMVGRDLVRGSGDSRMETIAMGKKLQVAPGQKFDIQIGGLGRVVVGKATLPSELAQRKDWTWSNFVQASSKITLPDVPIPDDVKNGPMDGRKKWYDDFLKTDAGKEYLDKRQKLIDAMRNYPLELNQDGTFRIQDVEAGTYTINLSITSLTTPQGMNSSDSELASGSLEFTVPEMPGGRSNQTLEIPAVAMNMTRTIKVGDLAPDFTEKTLAGQDLKLSDLRGKYVLLDFWATWCGPCIAELPSIKSAYETFGSDPRFVMISVSLDEKAQDAKSYANKNGMAWNQIFQTGEWQAPIVQAYGVRAIPSLYLIGPDGKVIAKDLRGDAIKAAVAGALGK